MKWQFRLQTLLLTFVFVWSAMAAFGLWGIVVAGFLLVVLICIRFHRDGNTTPIGCIIILTMLGLAAFVLFSLPAVQSSRESARHVYCRHNLKQIALALLTYESIHGEFPPAYIADENGRPMHSWRVLILPYLERQKMYNAYDFTEPWDGPNNRKITEKPLSIFRCPAAGTDSPLTNYVVIIGPGTALQGGKSSSVDYISSKDGVCTTLLLLEVADSDIHWAEPRDLKLDDVLSADSESWKAFTSQHASEGYFFHRPLVGCNVAFADGHIRYLRGRPNPELLKALVTVDDHKIDGKIDNSGFERPPLRIHWPHCIALAIFLLSFVLLLRKAWIKPASDEGSSVP